MKPITHRLEMTVRLVPELGAVNVIVEGKYWPMMKGARDGRFGPPIEPDEPESFEIESVKLDGREIIDELNDESLEQLEKDCLQKLEDDWHEDHNAISEEPDLD